MGGAFVRSSPMTMAQPKDLELEDNGHSTITMCELKYSENGGRP